MRILISIISAISIMVIYWCSGGNFERGTTLAFWSATSGFAFIGTYALPNFWRISK